MIEIGPNLAQAMQGVAICLFAAVAVWAFFR